MSWPSGSGSNVGEKPQGWTDKRLDRIPEARDRGRAERLEAMRSWFRLRSFGVQRLRPSGCLWRMTRVTRGPRDTQTEWSFCSVLIAINDWRASRYYKKRQRWLCVLPGQRAGVADEWPEPVFDATSTYRGMHRPRDTRSSPESDCVTIPVTSRLLPEDLEITSLDAKAPHL